MEFAATCLVGSTGHVPQQRNPHKVSNRVLWRRVCHRLVDGRMPNIEVVCDESRQRLRVMIDDELLATAPRCAREGRFGGHLCRRDLKIARQLQPKTQPSHQNQSLERPQDYLGMLPQKSHHTDLITLIFLRPQCQASFADTRRPSPRFHPATLGS